VADDVSPSQPLAEVSRLLADIDGVIEMPEVQVEGAQVRVRPGQLRAGRQCLEHPDGFFGRSPGFLPAAQPPERLGEHAEVVADASVIAELAAEPERGAQRPSASCHRSSSEYSPATPS